MPEKNQILWAPWRMEYLRSLQDDSPQPSCFLCDYAASPDRDRQNLVVWRTPACLAVLNRYPYTNGHLLIAPLRHLDSLSELGGAELAELAGMVRDSLDLVGPVVRADGFNVGMNFGRCAGAGLPDHLHAHVVPRWNGDTNFVPVLGGTRIIPQDLDELYAQLRRRAADLGLPRGGPVGSPEDGSRARE